MTIAYACGKVILFGEHAVVYGQPAIAVPLTQVRARATVEDAELGEGITIVAEDLGRIYKLGKSPPDDPLRVTILSTLRRLKLTPEQDLTVAISSTIPIARGLGSGAAVSTAIVRALAKHFDRQLALQAVSELVYETEKIHHSTPSGIDNTVIAYEAPIYFVKGRGMELLEIGRPFLLAIADTGVQSSTKEVVGDVRRAWKRERARYEEIFEEIGAIAEEGRRAIELGKIEAMGRLMDENHRLLREIGVSSLKLEGLVEAARQGGALGAKLSGAGRGGNMIALVTKETCGRVETMLRMAGAKNVIVTEVR
ncbi:MAG: mevalonate kinase [Chloroflexota bacterium]|nr:mevalonate kinase [Chloroflexota bacterium]